MDGTGNSPLCWLRLKSLAAPAAAALPARSDLAGELTPAGSEEGG
jgi:hypothetical protein